MGRGQRTALARSAGTALLAALLLVTAVPSRGAGAQTATARDITRFACPVDLIGAPFTDIAGNPHEVAIVCLFSYGITQGTSETRYSPSQFVRRGQMARFLFRLLESQGVPMDVSDRGFTDVAGHPHREAINGLASVGVAQGRTTTRFAPEELITRGEMATFLFRVADLFGPPMPAGQNAFTDDDGNRHEAAIDAVAAARIAQGTGNRRFDPNGGVTRGAMAAFLTRFLDWGIESFTMTSFATTRVAAAALVPGEVPGGGTAGASGTVVLATIGMDDVLCFALEADDLGATATSAHLHKAAPGTAGAGVGQALTPPTAQNADFPTADVASGGCIVVSPTFLADVVANPEAYYADIHTASGDPAVRGQLGEQRSALGAELDGTKEVPNPGDADGIGLAGVDTTSQPDDLCFFVIVQDVAAPTAAHIHRGREGVSGGIVVPLKAPTPTPLPGVFTASGCLGGLDPALVSEIDATPGDFYVNVHNADFPDGAVRGQLLRFASLSATLTGASEVPGPGDADGGGDAFVVITRETVVCYALVVGDIGTPTAAHIHRAAAGQAGAIVVTLETPPADGFVLGCADGLEPALVHDVADHPSDFSVNVHTAAFPEGAIRGQLGYEPGFAPPGAQPVAAAAAWR